MRNLLIALLLMLTVSPAIAQMTWIGGNRHTRSFDNAEEETYSPRRNNTWQNGSQPQGCVQWFNPPGTNLSICQQYR